MTSALPAPGSVAAAGPDRGDGDWMGELARHYRRMRAAYPDGELVIVFDIDGTILDVRHQVVHVLLAYDRERGTEHFHGLRPEDVDVHEDLVDELLLGLPLPAEVRRDVLGWYRERLWSPQAVLAGSRPYQGVLGVIRWFQLQPRTHVALNTGRPGSMRELTLRALNALGRAHRVSFRSDLLLMNPSGWHRGVEAAKAAAIRSLRARGFRVVAVVDNEPANLEAMAAADEDGEILFLHAETIFASQRRPIPRSVAGRRYGLADVVSERDLAGRVAFVWHGVNDEANLRQFLASDVRWAEADVRRDPLDRLVLRHDPFEEDPWSRDERPFLLVDLLHRLGLAGRAVKLDLKEGGEVADRALAAAAASGLAQEDVWWHGAVEDLGEPTFRRLARAARRSVRSVEGGFLAPLVLGAPEVARRVLRELAAWGVSRISLPWGAPRLADLLDVLERWGWQVNLYDVPDLEGFLHAALLLPASVTADFNFPERHHYGRGPGRRRVHHRYALV